MDIIEKYITYREIGRELNNKIMDTCLDQDMLKNSARLLGIARGNILMFDSEDDTSVLMDFALNEYRVNNKNAIEIYRERYIGRFTVIVYFFIQNYFYRMTF